MAGSLPTKAVRDGRLDVLKQSVKDWADKEIARLENESKFLKSVLQKRGSSGVEDTNLNKASTLVEEEIDNFLNVRR